MGFRRVASGPAVAGPECFTVMDLGVFLCSRRVQRLDMPRSAPLEAGCFQRWKCKDPPRGSDGAQRWTCQGPPRGRDGPCPTLDMPRSAPLEGTGRVNMRHSNPLRCRHPKCGATAVRTPREGGEGGGISPAPHGGGRRNFFFPTLCRADASPRSTRSLLRRGRAGLDGREDKRILQDWPRTFRRLCCFFNKVFSPRPVVWG